MWEWGAAKIFVNDCEKLGEYLVSRDMTSFKIKYAINVFQTLENGKMFSLEVSDRMAPIWSQDSLHTSLKTAHSKS